MRNKKERTFVKKTMEGTEMQKRHKAKAVFSHQETSKEICECYDVGTLYF
jgi:hypothetical protein